MKSHTGCIDAFANVFMLSGNFVCFSLAKFEIEERLIIHPSILLLSKICLLCQIEYLLGNLIFQFRVWSRRHIQSDFSRASLCSVSDIPTQKQRNKRHLIFKRLTLPLWRHDQWSSLSMFLYSGRFRISTKFLEIRQILCGHSFRHWQHFHVTSF